ncbi:MAG: hypothetical protein ACR2NB_04015 [Solirubrobacteraceae bacterium]
MLETGEHILLLGIHGEDAEGTLDLSFTTVPNEELLAGVAVALVPQAEPRAMVAFFTVAAAMTSAVTALRAKLGPTAVNQVKQTALFLGPFTISRETLEGFA